MWTNLERFSNISNILTASRPINIKAGIIFDPSGKQGTPLVLHSPTCSSQDSTIEVTTVYYYYSKSIQCWVPCCLVGILILGHPSLFLGGKRTKEEFWPICFAISTSCLVSKPQYSHTALPQLYYLRICVIFPPENYLFFKCMRVFCGQ